MLEEIETLAATLGLTVTLIGDEVAEQPALFVARTVYEFVPVFVMLIQLVVALLFHRYVNPVEDTDSDAQSCTVVP